MVFLSLDAVVDIYYFWVNNFRMSEGLKVIIIEKEKSTISHHSIREVMNMCVKYGQSKIKSAHSKQLVQTFGKNLRVN